MRRHRFTIPAALLLGSALLPAALSGAAPPPAPKEDPEIKMGREAHESLLKGGIKLVSDPKLVTRVETIGNKLADLVNVTPIPATYGSENKTPYAYKFFIVDDADINAFSLPGGFIYINKGLLNYVQSDDELAGVLGHEIAHAAHHHVAKLQREQSQLNTQMAIAALVSIVARVPMSDTGNLLSGFQLVALQKVSGFSQNAERDADHAGIILAKKGGYNPVGMLTFMERLARDQRNRPDVELGIFRTHPPERDRADSMVKQITSLGLPINRRETTSMLKVTVRTEGEAAAAVSEVLIDGKVFFRTSSAQRAQQAAETLDRMLDQNLQLYDITKRGNKVLARGETVVAIEPTDTVALTGPISPETLTDQAYKALRNALYRYALDGVL
jgi:predicted Zn-dependent protease